MNVSRYYYGVNRILMLSVGLWPEKNGTFQKIQRIFISILLASSVGIQVAQLTLTEYSADFLIDVLCHVCPYLVFNLKYCVYSSNLKLTRELIEKIETDWELLKYDRELEIMREDAHASRTYTIICTLTLCVLLGILLVIQILPCLLNVVAPLNDSRPHRFILTTKLFVYQPQYFFTAMVVMWVAMILGTIVVIATNSIYLVCVRHVCSIFRVVSYRIEYALNDDLSVVPISQRSSIIRSRIIDAIKIHNRAFGFSKCLQDNFVFSYLILVSIGVGSLSIHLFQLLKTITMKCDVIDFGAAVSFVFADLCYMFLGNYIGQMLTDQSNEVYKKTYDSRWYEAPLQVQKSLLIILSRSMRTCTLVLGGILVLCFEGFATITSMSLSYFMVIYSLHS